jgi:cell wall-associated NlpC family hydrolase
VGTPWVHQQGLRRVGTDCIGLIVGVGKALGVAEAYAFAADNEVRGYGPEPNVKMLIAACERYLDPGIENRPGDIVLMAYDKPRPMHFGILTGPDPHTGQQRMIHGWAYARRVVEHGIDAVWAQRIVRTFSYRGLA